MKLSETDDDRRAPQFDYIEQRWKQLHELEVKRGDTAINYLFMVSGGASAAVLAFIGNVMKEEAAIPQSAVWMLGCFAASLIFVGAMKGAIALHVIAIYKNWRALVRRYYADEIGWKDLYQSDETIVRRWEVLHQALGAIAFLFIIGGVVIGLLKFQEESLRGHKLEKTVATEEAGTQTSNSGERKEIENDGRKAQVAGGRPGGPAATPAGKEVTAEKADK